MTGGLWGNSPREVYDRLGASIPRTKILAVDFRLGMHTMATEWHRYKTRAYYTGGKLILRDRMHDTILRARHRGLGCITWYTSKRKALYVGNEPKTIYLKCIINFNYMSI